MKRFILIFVLMLITFVSNAQYINPNIRQDNTTPAQWNEWKGLMSQYNNGKTLIYGGLAVGAVGVTTFAILRENITEPIRFGSSEISVDDAKRACEIGLYTFGIGAAGAVVWGIIKRNDARHKLDRFYFNNGFIFTF